MRRGHHNRTPVPGLAIDPGLGSGSSRPDSGARHFGRLPGCFQIIQYSYRDVVEELAALREKRVVEKKWAPQRREEGSSKKRRGLLKEEKRARQRREEGSSKKRRGLLKEEKRARQRREEGSSKKRRGLVKEEKRSYRSFIFSRCLRSPSRISAWVLNWA